MVIKINERFEIHADERNYILYENKEVKEGKNKGAIRQDVIGYYRDLKQTLKKLVDFSVMADDLQGVKEVIKRLDEIKADIDRLKNAK